MNKSLRCMYNSLNCVELELFLLCELVSLHTPLKNDKHSSLDRSHRGSSCSSRPLPTFSSMCAMAHFTQFSWGTRPDSFFIELKSSMRAFSYSSALAYIS